MLVLLLLMAPACPAVAWEFSMSGRLTWKYQGYGQRGAQGFFGPYGVDRGAGNNIYLFPRDFGDASDYDWVAQPGDFAGYNGWLGSQVGDISSGSGASVQTIFTDMNMLVRVNKAITVSGSYRIGSYKNESVSDSAFTYDFNWGPSYRDDHGTQLFRTYVMPDLVKSEYVAGMYPGVQKAFSPGYWRTLWGRVELPWGTVLLGKRPFSFGTGMMLDGGDNTSTESLMLVAPYGPMKFAVMWYPFRLGSKAYYNPFDDNAKNAVDIGGFATYEAGPVSLGLLAHHRQSHIGPEGARTHFIRYDEITDLLYRQIMQFEDTSSIYGVVYAKYNNGRFFFNAELDWYDQITTRNLATDVSNLDSEYILPRPNYIQHWRFITELGLTAGPAKSSFLYAWVSGPDIRHGRQIDKTGALPIQWLRNLPGEDFYEDYQWLDVFGAYRILPTSRLTNTGVFKPYSLVMVYNFGLGTDINPDTGEGWVQDASCFAARLDYAVAANLNIFGTFFTAERTSKSGYTWGYIRPSQQMDGSVDRGNRAPNNGDYINNPIPTIPETDLGWEVGVGFNWKLLEGMTINSTFGYWQPGKWFSYACIDRRIANWGEPGNARYFHGVSPVKTIDPIWGMEFDCTFEF